ncbi:MAG: ABC-type transporter, integral rane subunit, partial [Anaerocolumna sp.]|nr:ABC-type transporter, integral rane subunit [Anaerocolumna sp.]
MSNLSMSKVKSKNGIGNELSALLKTNIRDYVMYIALALIFILFGILTDGLFLSPRNISDLINQTGYVAILAIGMTIILIIKHIDLSVGYVAGFLGAVAAILMRNGLSAGLVIPIILVLGICVGLYQGFLVSKVGVPAFVTTLAGMFIFRGLLSMVTAGSGTIIVKEEGFKALSQGYIPDIPVSDNFHFLTLVIGIIAITFLVISQIKLRNNLLQYNFEVNSMPIF